MINDTASSNLPHQVALKLISYLVVE